MPLTEYQIRAARGPKTSSASYVQRSVGLPRKLQTAWSQALAAAGDVSSIPGWFLLATTCAAATAARPDVHSHRQRLCRLTQRHW